MKKTKKHHAINFLCERLGQYWERLFVIHVHAQICLLPCYLGIQIYRSIFFSTGSACDTFSTASRSFVSYVLQQSGKSVWKVTWSVFIWFIYLFIYLFVKAKTDLVVNKTNLFLSRAQTHANAPFLIRRSYQEKALQLVFSVWWMVPLY